MPNVKPGDLCIILGVTRTPSLNGRVVEVIRKAFHGDTFKRLGNYPETRLFKGTSLDWEVSSSEALPWKLANTEYAVLHESVAVADIRLFKIKDKDVDVETETIKELELEKV